MERYAELSNSYESMAVGEAQLDELLASARTGAWHEGVSLQRMKVCYIYVTGCYVCF